MVRSCVAMEPVLVGHRHLAGDFCDRERVWPAVLRRRLYVTTGKIRPAFFYCYHARIGMV